MSDWISITALVLAVLAIVIMLVLFFLLFRDNEQTRAVVDQWVITAGGSGPTESFTGGPNAMYLASSTNATTVNVLPYTGIATGVTNNTTTFFMINNQAGNNDITVKDPAGSSFTVTKGKSALFYWTSATTIKFITW